MCYNFQKNGKKIFLPKACANFDRFFGVESRMLYVVEKFIARFVPIPKVQRT
jgi:hypothetical protein